MAVRPAHPALAAFATLALLGGAASAHTHHAATPKYKTTDRHVASKHRTTGKHDGHHVAKPTEHRGATPTGATSVPAGGLKIYCPARKGPLLIRKATQGSGTTVTVVCR